VPRLTRIYTRQGDDGETSLGSGRRVPKDDVRVEAYGVVDELNAVLGTARAEGLDPAVEAVVRTIQNELFHLGSDLCFPEEERGGVEIPRIEERHVTLLEGHIDRFLKELSPLENFILPGGTKTAAGLHVARTVCRRAERATIRLCRTEKVGADVVKYLNRLSDLLFVLARVLNRADGGSDVLWQQGRGK
jgi:cob(I)alamin adenosyltransferase